MSKFDRRWSMQLPVKKERFIRAFGYVVAWENPMKDVESAFYGRIYEKKFYIKKRRIARYQIGLCDLNGKMQENADGLLLELEMRNNWKFNYFEMTIYAVGIGFALFLGLPGTDYMYLTLPVLFALVLFIEVKLVHLYQNYSKQEYTKLVTDIATLDMTDKAP